MAAGDAFASHVGQCLIHELRGKRTSFADKTAIKPLFGNALELSKEMQLRLIARIAPLCVEQPMSEMKEKGRSTKVACVNQIEIDTLTNNTLIRRMRWPYHIRGEFQH